MLHMVKNYVDKKEREVLIQLYETIDDDRDSQIDVEDIAKAYRDKYGMTISDSDMIKIGKQVDVSREGGITITEFILGACNKNLLITDQNLRSVFSYIDANQNNIIGRDELKSFLGVNDDIYVGLIIEDADDDCDGGLNYKEFNNMMTRMARLGTTSSSLNTNASGIGFNATAANANSGAAS